MSEIDYYHTFEVVKNATLPARALFYLVTPAESSPATMAEVPDFVTASFPYFITMVIIEVFGSILTGKRVYQWNDMLTSVSAGLFSRIPELFRKSLDMAGYLYIWNNWRLFEMPSDSAWTWLFCLLAFDLGYYWFHRAAHEVNFLWAFHQTHHSSEYYNLSTALRQPVLAKYATYIFYLPIAFFVPPSIYLVHMQLNLLFQFWIHTELIGNLGPLELVLNTASHHRVHHGRNPYCIDKNYAGFLIIWDRLFGTFEAERENEKVHYGLIHNIKTFDAFSVQFCTFNDIWRKFRANMRSTKYHGLDKVKNCLKAVFYGPGWFSRKPYFRLGDPADLPPVEPNPVRWDPYIPLWQCWYSGFHFLFATMVYTVATGPVKHPVPIALAVGFAVIAQVASIGYIFNRSKHAKKFELARCAIILAGAKPILDAIGASFLLDFLRVFYALSVVAWLICNNRVDTEQPKQATELPAKKEQDKSQ